MHQPAEGEKRDIGADRARRRQGPRLRGQRRRRRAVRRRPRLLEVGQGPTGEGARLGALGRGLAGRARRAGRRRLQPQGVDRRLRVRGHGRRREEEGGGAAREARGHLQPRPREEADPRDQQAGGEGQGPQARGGEEVRVRRQRQVRHLRARGRRGRGQGGHQGRRDPQPRRDPEGEVGRRVQHARDLRDLDAAPRGVRHLPPALEDRGELQGHEVRARRQARLPAEAEHDHRPLPRLLPSGAARGAPAGQGARGPVLLRGRDGPLPRARRVPGLRQEVRQRVQAHPDHRGAGRQDRPAPAALQPQQGRRQGDLVLHARDAPGRG